LFNTDTDLLFPPRAIPSLCDQRGQEWQKLITKTLKAGTNSLEQIALILMMARINSCATCNSDSYRAMNGCTSCSKQTLKRFRGSDKELQALFDETKLEVELNLKLKQAK
jgi:hypothetical protein